MSDIAVIDQGKEMEKVWDDDVKGRSRLFVLFYCTDDSCFLNGTRAYKKAYTKKHADTGLDDVPSDEVAAVGGSRLLRNAKVKTAIRLLNRAFRDESDEEAGYRILKQYETLAFYDPADIINAKGELIVKDLKDLGPLSRCISGIETKPTEFGTQTTVKLSERRAYMQDIGRYLNLIRPDNSGAVMVPVFMMNQKSLEMHWSAENADSESNTANPDE